MPRIKKHIIIFLVLFGINLPNFAQLIRKSDWGFNVGVVFALGNRFQRIGFTFQSYYYYKFAQVNAEVRAYYNLKNLGPEKQYGEIVASAGLVLAYGKKQKYYNPFLSSISNQTRYRNSFAYSYNWYFNKIKTKQRTGTVAVQIGDFSFISENDLLATPALDRFRSAAVLLQYQYKNKYQAALNCTMWTGQMGKVIRDNKDFPFIGYVDTTGGVYTNYSHGLLSAQFKMALDAGQNIQANLGVDAEQVRNALQNRFMHDAIFIPKKWYKTVNNHIPMIDQNGNQYLYKPDQKVRKPELYWNVFTGAGNFY